MADRFRLDGRVAVITGGGGMLGAEHGAAIAEAGGIPVLLDINERAAQDRAEALRGEWKVDARGFAADITDVAAVAAATEAVLVAFGRIDILINNAAHNPKVDTAGSLNADRFEQFSRDQWDREIAVGLTGSFLCSQAIGRHMAAAGSGVIVNIASDLGVIAPDQRIYRKDGVADNAQPVKPVTYSVIKHGLIGLTRYLATYWPDKGVRANALCPGGVFDDQPNDFLDRLVPLIPMGRMADRQEYRGAIQFLCSDASSYMTGAVLSVDGGRTVW